MFEEEEWTEAVAADEQIYAVCSVKTKEKSSKVISKRRLKQTLQALGSVPVWDETKLFEDSDEAEGKAPVRVNKTKKRCKKRKKILDAENDGEQNGAVDAAEKLVKKRKPKRREPSLDTSLESAKGKSMTEKNSGSPGDAAEGRLSRQQWKNKMKNKKRCKNKFSQGLAEVAKVMQQGEPLQTQALSKAQNTQSHDLSSGSVRSGEKNGSGVPINAHPSKDATAVTDKKRSITKYLKATVDKPVSKGPKAGNNVCSSPCEPCEKPMPVKGKNNQLQAKKLRHVLNDHMADRHKKIAEEKREPLNMDNEEGKSPPDRSQALRSRMEKRLESARFRHINEQLYTSTSGEARRMFKQDPDAIGIYHRGYTEQVKHWPVNPVDLIISYIQQKPQSLVVADFGCGDCKIARSVKNRVHCFDLAPVCELVTACDMARVPLDDCTVDIAVFCLSLMGTNLSDFLAEANRVLQMGGILKIAEVASRFDNIRQFISALSHLGFKLVTKDTDNSHFFSFEFVKVQNAPSHMKKAGLQLRPCLYKKR